MSCFVGDVDAADELIDVVVSGLETADTGSTIEFDSRLRATNCTKSCNWFTCCIFGIKWKNLDEINIVQDNIYTSYRLLV